MKSKQFRVFVLFLFLPFLAFSQERDFGIWYGVNVETGLTKKLELDVSGHLRTFENASGIDELFGEIGLSYEILKWLDIGLKYRLTSRVEDDSRYHLRHKWIADIKSGTDIGDIGLSGRLRIQRQDKTYFEDANDEIPDYYMRFRLKLEYKTPSFPINPFTTFETFTRIFEEAEKTIEKYRFGIGFEYKLNKNHSFEGGYLFQRDHFPGFVDTNILEVSYKLSL